MNDNGELAPVKARDWTRIDDYFEALARRRTARRSRRLPPRTEPESPRFALSTLPFLALLAGLAVLAVGIAVNAWPGSQPPAHSIQTAKSQPGFAAKGWYQEAEKDMRRKN